MVSSCSILLSRYSCFLVNMASVSLSLLMASCGDGPDRDRCLDLELDPELELGLELDELDELTLNNFEILLIFSKVLIVILVKDPTCLKLYADKISKRKWQFLTVCFSDSIQNTNISQCYSSWNSTPNLRACKLLHNNVSKDTPIEIVSADRMYSHNGRGKVARILSLIDQVYIIIPLFWVYSNAIRHSTLI